MEYSVKKSSNDDFAHLGFPQNGLSHDGFSQNGFSHTDFSHNEYKDRGFVFFEPLLRFCKKLEGNGDIEDEAILFVAVVMHPGREDEVLIVTTERGHDRKSLDIQNIESLLVSKHAISNIKIVYSTPKDIHAILHDADSSGGVSGDFDESKSTALRDLKNIVTEAVKVGASDIHFYVYEDRAEVVFRVDGVFGQRTPLGRLQAISIIAAGLNTKSSDYRSVTDDDEMVDVSIHLSVEVVDAVDGKISRQEKINLRTSKSAAIEGPHTVMRVIRTSQDVRRDISDLGLDRDIRDMLVQSLEAPNGIIVVTGPTGSGKSTTLASLYEEIPEDRKVILLEDPVEYRVRRKNTVQKTVFQDVEGKGFADYLKNALRQDPDVIGISEMRDGVVAEIVIRSALTGHLMVTTMHTNDAIATLSRLIDEGISSEMLSERNLLRCVVAQRLIPALCAVCKESKKASGFKNAFVKKSGGCGECNNTGYKGRVMVAELILFDDVCRGYILQNDLEGMERHLKSVGWMSMTDRAKMLIEKGVIDPFEARWHVTSLFEGESAVSYPASIFGQAPS